MRRLLIFILGWCGAFYIVLLRLTLRLRAVNDPRPQLKAEGKTYVYAILHSQQLNFVLFSDDVPIAAMVSGSKDGDVLVPPCRVRKIIPVRGSSRKRGKDKGGSRALVTMIKHVKAGIPGLLAVDGPRGPRSTVHWGIVDLALKTDSLIIVAGIFPRRRFILKKTWDRTQIPWPLTKMEGRFRPPIDPKDFADRTSLRAHVAAELLALEQEFDPNEARYAVGLTDQQTSRPQVLPPA